jgi:hypothetical protein
MDDQTFKLKNTMYNTQKLKVNAYFVGNNKVYLIKCLIFNQKIILNLSIYILFRAILTDSTTSLRNLYISFFP